MQPDNTVIRRLIEFRAELALELATMPSFREGTRWAIDRYRQIERLNRQLSQLGHQD